VLAWLTYVFVEKPIRFGQTGNIRIAALAASLALVGCAGYYTYAHGGLPNRSANRALEEGFQEKLQFNQQQLTWFGPDPACFQLTGLEEERKNQQEVFCSLKDDLDSVQVAIIGDSTANALYPGFRKVLNERGIGLINLGNAKCGPYRGLQGTVDWNKDCDQIDRKIYDFLLANSRIKTVILGMVAWDVPDMRFDGIPDNAPLQAKFAMFDALVNRDIAALRAAGKNVVITYDTPPFATDARVCIPRSPRDKLPAACTPTEDQLRSKEREPFVSMWKAILAKHKDVCIFEQSPYLKTNGRFHMLNSDGILLFRDDHHLTYVGSEYIARKFFESPCGPAIEGLARTGEWK